jgi:phage-related tail fiber protein
MSIKHQFQSGRADNSDAGAIQPSMWDADHQLDGLLAAIDTGAPTPNVIFAMDGSAQFQLLPISTFAPSFSPVFTGVPLAPTPDQSVNSDQIATASFVKTAIANLVSSAPTTLETLNEIASALGDDPNFSATITAALGFRLRIDAAQGLTSGQQAQGRSNLGLATVSASGAYSDLSGLPGLGTASALNVGTAANQVVQLDGTGKLPAVDGSRLTNVAVALPVGMCVHFPGNAAPTGFLPRNGALVSRTTFAALWAYAQASGNLAASDAAWSANNWGQFSPGDGSTTFRLPDDRGEFIRGWDNGRGVDTGRTIGSWQADAFQGHVHNTFGLANGSGLEAGPNFSGASPTNTGSAITDGVNGTPRIAAETRPRNVAWIGCIKF